MADTTISNSQTARINLSGTDTLTVTATGNLSVSANAQSVRFNGPTTNGIITNSGTIENTAAGGRAIRVETSVGSNFTATITNNAGGVITSLDDAVQIQAGSVTAGTLTVNNSGIIQSSTGQALDLAGGTGAAIQSINNSGSILAVANDAVRFGGVGTLINTGTINGGSAAAYSGGDGVQIEDSNTNLVTITNSTAGGQISGDRHGINGGLGTNVSVTNNVGATITGRNGSGVGLDGNGSITNYGVITGAFSNSAGSDINGSTIGQPNGGGPDGINDGDGDGIDIDGEATINNYGIIEGTGAGGTGSDGRFNTSEGIAAGGGTINNYAGAMITGGGLGILIDDSATGNAPFATFVTNAGTIQAGSSYAIRLIGLQNDTVDNSGTISGGFGVAMLLGGGDDTLVIRDGSSINGTSDGEGGTDTLGYQDYSVGVTVNLLLGTATGTGGVTNFENVNGWDYSDTITGDANANKINGGKSADTLAGGAGNDTFIVIAGDTNGFESYDGGADDDTLQIDGGGTVDFTGVAFSDMENAIITDAAGTRVILSTAQINAFTGTLDAQGSDDTFEVSDLAFLNTFGTPAARAAAFALITDLHAGGVENVEWQESGATTVAKVIGLNVVVTSTDNGSNNWGTSTFIFDAATGNRVSKETTMDDGSIVTRTFGTGPTADIVLSDIVTDIVGAVNSTTTTYDTAGRVNNRTVTYDDGRSNHTEYDDSNRVDSRTDTAANGFATTSYYNDSNQRVSVFSDDSASDQYAWLSSTLTLDPANGQVTEKFTVLDNGNTVTENYSGGLLASRITEDGGANEAFTSVTQNFAAGVFQWQSIVYDNNTGLIQGSASANTISQNNGVSDAIIGGGGADVFVFAVGGGADRITDFSQAQGDKLDLRDFGIDEVSDITSYTQAGPHLVLNFGGGDTVQINGITFAALTNADLVA